MKHTLLIVLLLWMLTSSAMSTTIVISTISSDPLSELRVFRPFADYLARTLPEKSGVKQVDVKIAGSIPQAINWLKKGKIDLFIDSSITALTVNKQSGATLMLRRWKKGRGEYRSVIFARADRQITSLSDLKGKVIAFEEPFSTSGYMLPAMELMLNGIELEVLSSPRDLPTPNTVGAIMAYDNETQITWVERDIVTAAAMSERDYIDFEKNALEPLQIIQTTEFVPYHVISQRDGFDQTLSRQIKEVLKKAHETEQGRAVLKGFGTLKFDEIPEGLLANALKFEPHLDSLPQMK